MYFIMVKLHNTILSPPEKTYEKNVCFFNYTIKYLEQDFIHEILKKNQIIDKFLLFSSRLSLQTFPKFKEAPCCFFIFNITTFFI